MDPQPIQGDNGTEWNVSSALSKQPSTICPICHREVTNRLGRGSVCEGINKILCAQRGVQDSGNSHSVAIVSSLVGG